MVFTMVNKKRKSFWSYEIKSNPLLSCSQGCGTKTFGVIFSFALLLCAEFHCALIHYRTIFISARNPLGSHFVHTYHLRSFFHCTLLLRVNFWSPSFSLYLSLSSFCFTPHLSAISPSLFWLFSFILSPSLCSFQCALPLFFTHCWQQQL